MRKVSMETQRAKVSASLKLSRKTLVEVSQLFVMTTDVAHGNPTAAITHDLQQQKRIHNFQLLPAPFYKH